MADVESGRYQQMHRTRSQELRDKYGSAWNVPKTAIASPDQEMRGAFLRKVYGILTAQMVMTVAIAATMMFTPGIRDSCLSAAMSGNRLIQLGVFIPTMASLCCLQSQKNQYPTNYLLLSVFTFFMSINVGFICSVYYATGLGMLIVQAFLLTAMIFFGLSAYALFSGKDFSYMGGILSAGLMLMVGIGFIGFFIPSLVNNIVYSLCGALLFCGFIVFDTWKIENAFGYDDYIVAAIELYLDIINLFLYILQILAQSQRD
eukprot:gnl/TRDRNA2_/TRDRNA2_90459_c0_seq1.p1 gnl/TRDRNA2_/TRDRNA2_90459_c0~~gnl/TRDRNA2_/TRDRNA2_90459_c0_seq1.p1  ORF type:complete len:284 (+),score=57.07 gnl/TRDRNA2_/TRDRNA2_90459_c0_seq1:75-854(+)